jgi:magnesium chelatase family protein
VKGQETAKRALEIAAAGGHNLLMTGPPGAGKSLLAACLPGILPNSPPPRRSKSRWWRASRASSKPAS